MNPRIDFVLRLFELPNEDYDFLIISSESSKSYIHLYNLEKSDKIKKSIEIDNNSLVDALNLIIKSSMLMESEGCNIDLTISNKDFNTILERSTSAEVLFLRFTVPNCDLLVQTETEVLKENLGEEVSFILRNTFGVV